MALRFLPCGVIQTDGISVYEQAAETLTQPERQLVFETAAFRQNDRTEQVQPCVLR